VAVDPAGHGASGLGQLAGLVWVDTYSTLGTPQADEEIQAFLAPFREGFVTATRALVRRLFPPDADAELVEWVATDTGPQR
jgi:hypothetical protein